MSFTPINKHIEVEPIKQDGLTVSADHVYEEKGKVISIAEDLPDIPFSEGDVVYFDSWLCAKFPDESGTIHYLVEMSAIRAYESLPKQ